MKNYRITVNGNTYDVQVEELNGAVATKAPTVTQATPVATPVPVAAPAAAPAPDVYKRQKLLFLILIV